MLLAPVKGQDICPTVGSSRKDLKGLPGIGSRLLLDLSRPAQCSGVVTGWSYCAHLPARSNVDDNRQFSAVFAIFQRTSPLSTVYETIDASLTTVNVSVRDNDLNFVCYNHSLSADAYFDIPKNALVGACILSGGRGLDVTSRASGATRPVIRRVDSPIYNGCRYAVITDESVNTISGANPVDKVLHVEAQISKFVIFACIAVASISAISKYNKYTGLP